MANEGIKALRRIQMARMADSDSDTAVPATTWWRGEGTLEDLTNSYYVNEDIGDLVGTDRSNISSVGGKLSLDAVEASPEQVPHILEMGIRTVTPTSDSGGGDGWIYQYDIPTSSTAPFKPYTIEGGDNAGAEVMPYVFCQDFTLGGNEKEAWKIGGTLMGKSITPQSFTGSVVLPSVTNLNFGMSSLYIDNDSDNWGTTIQSNTLLQAELSYTTGLIPKYTANGSLSFGFVQFTRPKAVLKITFEHNGNAINEKAYWKSQRARLIRISTPGDAFTVGGVYTNRMQIIDLAGKWMKFDKLGERNGNDVLQGTFEMRKNSVQASAGKFIYVNDLSSLP